jgi:hypothetical protein
MMYFGLTYEEIDLLIKAIDLKCQNYTLTDRDEDIDILRGIQYRLEMICQQDFEAQATAWEVPVQNEKGRTKHWFRSVEVRVFSELLYVFRARAEDLFRTNDPVTGHFVVLGNREYRSTDPAPAEIHLKALIVFRHVANWMRASGLTEESVKKSWT